MCLQDSSTKLPVGYHGDANLRFVPAWKQTSLRPSPGALLLPHALRNFLPPLQTQTDAQHKHTRTTVTKTCALLA